MRSMAVRPRIFSRLRCCAGVSSSSNTTVSASTAQRQLVQLLGLALADVGRGVGRVAPLQRRAPPTSAPAVSTSSASSSRCVLDLFGDVAWPNVDADEDDLLPEGLSVDQWSRDLDVAPMYVDGPSERTWSVR